MCRLRMVDTLGCESLTYGAIRNPHLRRRRSIAMSEVGAAGYTGAQKASLARSSANPSSSSCRNGTHSLSVPIASFLLSTI